MIYHNTQINLGLQPALSMPADYPRRRCACRWAEIKRALQKCLTFGISKQAWLCSHLIGIFSPLLPLTAISAKTPKEFNFDNPVQASLRAQLGDKESYQVSELRSSSTPTELRRSVYVAIPCKRGTSAARGYQCASP